MPNGWAPRDYQAEAWAALEAGKQKRHVWLWHRRAGKDLTALNWLATQAVQRVGQYWHLFPTYKQGRQAIWEGMDKGGRKFLDAIPEALVDRKLDAEMTMWLKNGSMFQVVGTDHIDRLMGSNPIGVIVSEYALQDPAAWSLISPILAENGGWAIFPYTPRGMNHGYDLFKFAQNHADTWFSQKLTVDDSGSVDKEVLAGEKDFMSKELFEQEYYVSFEAALVGAYYKEQLSWMAEQDPPRISERVNWIPDLEVITGWDLGMGDSTAIWFAQVIGREVRLFDYYEASGEPIDHYVKVMREGKRSQYVYGDQYLPFDAGQRSLHTGDTMIQRLRSLGIRPILNPKLGLSDKIDTVRIMLRQCWIHETGCKRGLQALREYTKQPMANERGPGGEILYQDRPLHNWASHGASALAELFIGFRPEREKKFKQPPTGYIV